MREILLAGFALLGAASVVLEVGARTGRLRTASLSQLVRAVACRRWSRLAVLAGWAWLGWHLFVR